jgi:hypothetical protein
MAMTPNKNEIRNMSRNGDSDWEILATVVNSGMEFPDAVYYVSSALGMDAEQRAEMERNYDECC